MRHGYIQVERGFAIDWKEVAVLSRMPIDLHRYMESSLDLIRCPVDRHHQSVPRISVHGKSIRFGEFNNGLVALSGWPEPVCEFGDSEEATVIGTGRIVELVQQDGDLILIPEGKHD